MTTGDGELWRVIPGWPEYQVSDHGRVRRIARNHGARCGRVLKAWVSLGYWYVQLWRGNRRYGVAVHRLVASAFLPPAGPGQTQVAHGDGNRLNCHTSNLRWATPVENAEDRHLHGTHASGEKNPGSKLRNADVPKIRELRRQGMTQKRIGEMFGVSRAVIGDIESGRRWADIP